MSDDPYVYPGTSVLKNRAGIRDPILLDRYERNIVAQRTAEGVPTGDFNLDHLRAIHRHLFQDIYEWAGEIRTVEMSKGGSPFLPTGRIVIGMEDVHRRIREQGYLKGQSPNGFAKEAGKIIGDINHVHPFREGNGRTQLQYLKQLTRHAGHGIALERLDQQKWITASIAANRGDYDPMADAIRGALVSRQKERSSGQLTVDQRLERLRDSADKAKSKDRKRDPWDRGR